MLKEKGKNITISLVQNRFLCIHSFYKNTIINLCHFATTTFIEFYRKALKQVEPFQGK